MQRVSQFLLVATIDIDGYAEYYEAGGAEVVEGTTAR
jgi:hypothetical protein